MKIPRNKDAKKLYYSPEMQQKRKKIKIKRLFSLHAQWIVGPASPKKLPTPRETNIPEILEDYSVNNSKAEELINFIFNLHTCVYRTPLQNESPMKYILNATSDIVPKQVIDYCNQRYNKILYEKQKHTAMQDGLPAEASDATNLYDSISDYGVDNRFCANILKIAKLTSQLDTLAITLPSQVLFCAGILFEEYTHHLYNVQNGIQKEIRGSMPYLLYYLKQNDNPMTISQVQELLQIKNENAVNDLIKTARKQKLITYCEPLWEGSYLSHFKKIQYRIVRKGSKHKSWESILSKKNVKKVENFIKEHQKITIFEAVELLGITYAQSKFFFAYHTGHQKKNKIFYIVRYNTILTFCIESTLPKNRE
jgi:hypothetical protein